MKCRPEDITHRKAEPQTPRHKGKGTHIPENKFDILKDVGDPILAKEQAPSSVVSLYAEGEIRCESRCGDEVDVDRVKRRTIYQLADGFETLKRLVVAATWVQKLSPCRLTFLPCGRLIFGAFTEWPKSSLANCSS